MRQQPGAIGAWNGLSFTETSEDLTAIGTITGTRAGDIWGAGRMLLRGGKPRTHGCLSHPRDRRRQRYLVEPRGTY